MQKNKIFDVVIIGGGISGTALLYELAKYTDIEKIALFEKYDDIATLNSNGNNNSQTLHYGDIETNYTLKKAQKIRKKAKMLEKYALQYNYEDKYMFKKTKMALGVGKKEVNFIKERYNEFHSTYPYLKLWNEEELEKIEPNLLKGRKEKIIAMGTETQYSAMNFGAISKTFVENAQKENKDIKIFLNEEIIDLDRSKGITKITSDKDTYFAHFVVVDAGAHSLLLAHKMDIGLKYSCLPIGGSFYYANDTWLKSKVYTVQNNKLPFAAIHGDPDILVDGKMRLGPTAIALPKLERYHQSHFFNFLETLKPDRSVFNVFYDLFSDKDIRNYVLKNMTYEIPGIRKSLFVKEAQKIIPTLREDDIEFAEGIGGLRPQVIDKEAEKLLLGEAKITTEKGLIFNMTPSPGATSCLGNALEDVKIICDYLKKNFNKKEFKKDLYE